MKGQKIIISEPKRTTDWTITVHFPNKEEAEDFMEDIQLFYDPAIMASFQQAARESKQGKARPIEELYKKYGV